MTPFRKAMTCAAFVLITLASMPSHLAAVERVAPTEVRASASAPGWFSATWSELVAWFAGAVVPPPPTGSGPATDGGCAVDPNGGCVEGQ